MDDIAPTVVLALTSAGNGDYTGTATAAMSVTRTATASDLIYFGINAGLVPIYLSPPLGTGISNVSFAGVSAIISVADSTNDQPNPSIVSITPNNVSFSIVNASNTNAAAATVTCDTAVDVTSSLSTTYSQENTLEVSQEVSYGIKLIGGKTTVTYSHQWGKSTTTEVSTTLSGTSDVSITLGQNANASINLLAVQGTAEFSVAYNMYLTGNVTYNRVNQPGSISISDLCAKMNLPAPTRSVTNDVNIDFFADTQVSIA